MDIIIFTAATIVILYFFDSILKSDPNEMRFIGSMSAPDNAELEL